jgi:outer membrane receptor for Fe3+-dicitrate
MDPNDKMSISVGVNFDYNNTKYSLESALNTNYLSQEYNTSFDFELPKLIFLSTEFTYTINSRRAQGFNTKVPIWNASVSKQFLKYNRGELKLSATDILKRNIGINRTTNQNYIEDSRVNTLRRFFMLTFTYSLSKTGLNNSGGGMMKIIRK